MTSQALSPHDPRQLLQWRPAHFLMALIALAGGATVWRLVEASGHFVEGSVQVETEGTKGTIEGGELVLDLPIRVFNGTDSRVMTVNMWTDAVACPSLNAPQSQCTRLHSSEQSLDLQVAAGSSGSQSQQIRTGLPEKMAGDYVRIKRRLSGIVSDVEMAENRDAEK